jgi:hypothetical protein
MAVGLRNFTFAPRQNRFNVSAKKARAHQMSRKATRRDHYNQGDRNNEFFGVMIVAAFASIIGAIAGFVVFGFWGAIAGFVLCGGLAARMCL